METCHRSFKNFDINKHTKLDNESPKGLNTTQRTTVQVENLGNEEVSFPKEEHTISLFSVKSVLNICTATILQNRLVIFRNIYVYKYLPTIKFSQKEAMNLKWSKEGCIGSLEGGKGEIV